jgi:hypothetical protein
VRAAARNRGRSGGADFVFNPSSVTCPLNRVLSAADIAPPPLPSPIPRQPFGSDGVPARFCGARSAGCQGQRARAAGAGHPEDARDGNIGFKFTPALQPMIQGIMGRKRGRAWLAPQDHRRHIRWRLGAASRRYGRTTPTRISAPPRGPKAQRADTLRGAVVRVQSWAWAKAHDIRVEAGPGVEAGPESKPGLEEPTPSNAPRRRGACLLRRASSARFFLRRRPTCPRQSSVAPRFAKPLRLGESPPPSASIRLHPPPSASIRLHPPPSASIRRSSPRGAMLRQASSPSLMSTSIRRRSLRGAQARGSCPWRWSRTTCRRLGCRRRRHGGDSCSGRSRSC